MPPRIRINWNRARPPEERFWSYVVKGVDPDDCWEWEGGWQEGYGYFRGGETGRDGQPKKIMAHRFSYELHHGPIPLGLLVCHTCNYRPCTNPRHLYAGTHADNAADAGRAGVLVRKHVPPSRLGEMNSAAVIDASEALTIYQRAWAGEKVATLGDAFGISKQTVSAIKLGQIWSEVTGHDPNNPPTPPSSRPPREDARFQAEVVLEIYRRAWDGESLRSLATEFGCSPGLVQGIKHGRSYQGITHHKKAK